jgi:hypothetical protein
MFTAAGKNASPSMNPTLSPTDRVFKRPRDKIRLGREFPGMIPAAR